MEMKMEMRNDKINPIHYNRLNPEPKDIQMSWNLSAFLFCVLKYIARAGYKEGDDVITDLEKAKRFLDFEIERIQKTKKE
jgi:hypothetical protein